MIFNKMITCFALLATPVLGAGLEIDVIGEANGTIVIDLFEDIAPLHTDRILAHAEAGWYDDIPFRRSLNASFVKLGHDLMHLRINREFDGVPAELSDFPVERGVVLVTPHGRILIMLETHSFTEPYTVVGVVTEGMEIVDAIKVSYSPISSFATRDPDVISSVRIIE